MPAREPAMPHQKLPKPKKRGAPKRPNAGAKAPKVPLPGLSFGHGVNTSKYATESEIKGPRY